MAAAGPYWQTYCGADIAALYAPLTRGLDCVVEVMRASGATPEAIAFLQAHGYFLYSFEELGGVDFGRGWAPWFNMGRTLQVLLLNGLPASLDVRAMLDLQFAELRGRRQPGPPDGYSELLANTANVFASSDRTRVAGSRMEGGYQVITLDVTLQECRACPVLGYMPVEFRVSPAGFFEPLRVLPLKAP